MKEDIIKEIDDRLAEIEPTLPDFYEPTEDELARRIDEQNKKIAEMGKVTELKEEEFGFAIRSGKVVIDCYANWCGPCKMLSPIIDEVAEKTPNMKFYKLDVDNAEKVASEYEIMSIPTILVFEDGKLIDKSIGLITKEQLLDLIH